MVCSRGPLGFSAGYDQPATLTWAEQPTVAVRPGLAASGLSRAGPELPEACGAGASLSALAARPAAGSRGGSSVSDLAARHLADAHRART